MVEKDNSEEHITWEDLTGDYPNRTIEVRIGYYIQAYFDAKINGIDCTIRVPIDKETFSESIDDGSYEDIDVSISVRDKPLESSGEEPTEDGWFKRIHCTFTLPNGTDIEAIVDEVFAEGNKNEKHWEAWARGSQPSPNEL